MPAPRNQSGAGSGGHDRLRNAHDKPLDTAFFAKKRQFTTLVENFTTRSLFSQRVFATRLYNNIDYRVCLKY